MVNENQQMSFGSSISVTTITMLVAGLLILLGIVFQLGELGYGHVSAHNLWFVSVVTQGAVNLLSSGSSGGTIDGILRWWPLALVSVGLAILMLQRGRS